MAARLAIESTLDGEDLAKALSATAVELGVADAVLSRLQKAVLLPQSDPPEGPWPDPRQQQIEDWATTYAETAVQSWLNDQTAWIRLNWGSQSLALPPQTGLGGVWWGLALGLGCLPLLLQQGVSWRQATAWVDGAAPGVIPPWPTTPRTRIPYDLRPILDDIQARATRWATAVADAVATTLTGGRRAGVGTREILTGLRTHFTGWSQDFSRLVRTEVAAGWMNATLATTTALYGTVHVHPDACPACHRLLEGQRFRLLKEKPADIGEYEGTAFWPDKWLLNWDRKPADWVPAIPLHPMCRCRLVPEKSLRKKG
ncbi:MAG: hypothetical protein M0Z36_10950 [Thermaerobacter sp.]|nr:hypothetical protein [Thermaerobacter sp.]